MIEADTQKREDVAINRFFLRALDKGESRCSFSKMATKKTVSRISLVVQWLSLCTPSAGDWSSVPGQGTRFCMLQLKSSNTATEDPECCN